MDRQYTLGDTSTIFSPGLLFFKDIIRKNIEQCLRMAGSPERLRPHVKTHKTREIVRMQLAVGISKHKCATIAEAEMLASCGVPDVLIAYNLVGPNCQRLALLIKAYPTTQFHVLADSARGLEMLSAALKNLGQAVSVLLDINVGQNRTGIASGNDAEQLYAQIEKYPGLKPGGFQVYDGHNRHEDATERRAAVASQLEPALKMRRRLEAQGLPVPRIVLGGTPTFPIHARLEEPGVECSPGTFVLHDQGYGSRFSDLAGFTPAALLLTRVVSKPSATRVTFDLGTKSIASDPPAGKRCKLLDVADYEPVIHNEEHFVIETSQADSYQIGDEVFAVPAHICPTCALHKFAYVVENGRVVERWEIAARDRILSI